jgi:hypothetical protein
VPSSGTGSSGACAESGTPGGYDYVLIVRPGLVEAAEANGFEWLGECVDELLGQTGVLAA